MSEPSVEATSAPLGSSRRAALLLGLALVVGWLSRLTLAFTDDGLHWPDEVYQSLEPAHRAVFGYGWVAWEFVEGARHWLFPGFIAGIFKLAVALGLSQPEGYLGLTRAVLCTLGIATAASVTLLTRRLGAAPLPSAIAGVVFALMGTAIYFAPRASSEVVSALPLTLGLALALPKPSRTWEIALGCGLLALATMLRLQNGLWCIGLLGVFIFERRWLALKAAVPAFAAGAFVYGAIDAWTWGEWFHSASVYLRFNLIEGRASEFGVAHPVYYVANWVRSEPFLLLPLLGLSILAWRKNAALGALMLFFLIVHSLIPHKELRFVFPLYALLCATAAMGLQRLGSQRPHWWKPAAAGLLALAVASSLTYRLKPFSSLGIRNVPAGTSSLDYGGPENRLLIVAGRRDDVCGVHLRSLENWRTGGYAYFHRELPLYPPRANPRPQHANYVIASSAPSHATLVSEDHGVGLYRFEGAPPCEADPRYDWTLDGVGH